MSAYYNEFDPYLAEWLRNLITAGMIPSGDVDERSIIDVKAEDLNGYKQCHFFAGIGGWGLAARLARWGDDRPLWTGSCPCQPFSTNGEQKGFDDERDLWPAWFSLIERLRPPVVMGEQVAGAVGHNWLDRVHDNMENIDYTVGAAIVPGCAVNSPQGRPRLWFVADTVGGINAAGRARCNERDLQNGPWKNHEWHENADGRIIRFKPGVSMLENGVPARVAKIRAFGNAIIPEVAAQVIAAYSDGVTA